MNIIDFVNNDSKATKIIKQFKLQNQEKDCNIAFIKNPSSEDSLKVKNLYKQYKSIFIVGLTDKKEKNIENLFNIGYDEVISLEEEPEFVILSQLKALIKEKTDSNNKIIKIGELEIPINGSYPCFRGQQISFSEKEMEILIILAKNYKKVISKKSIYEIIYGNKIGDPASPKVIDVFICKIRNILKKIGAEGYIKTISNQGYKIEPPVNHEILDEAV